MGHGAGPRRSYRIPARRSCSASEASIGSPLPPDRLPGRDVELILPPVETTGRDGLRIPAGLALGDTREVRLHGLARRPDDASRRRGSRWGRSRAGGVTRPGPRPPRGAADLPPVDARGRPPGRRSAPPGPVTARNAVRGRALHFGQPRVALRQRGRSGTPLTREVGTQGPKVGGRLDQPVDDRPVVLREFLAYPVPLDRLGQARWARTICARVAGSLVYSSTRRRAEPLLGGAPRDRADAARGLALRAIAAGSLRRRARLTRGRRPPRWPRRRARRSRLRVHGYPAMPGAASAPAASRALPRGRTRRPRARVLLVVVVET